jgi:hypothetical protein
MPEEHEHEGYELIRRALSSPPADALPTPEQVVLAGFDRAELWGVVGVLASSTAEGIVLVESFVYALPPRYIQARHPQIFPNVANVYSAKRNLFARLQHNRELARLHQELVSARASWQSINTASEG